MNGHREGAVSLAALLLDHPFANDEGLLHTRERTVTAGQARAEARTTAAKLTDAGVTPGQAVAVQLPNGPELVTAMFGVWLAGAVYVPINPRMPAPEADTVLRAVAPAALLTLSGVESVAGARTPH